MVNLRTTTVKSIIAIHSTAFALTLIVSAANATPVALSGPTATVEQGGFPITNTLSNADGNAGWATSSSPSVGVYQVSPGLAFSDGFYATFTFTLDSTALGDHVLGKFRLSYTHDNLPTAAGGNTWIQIPPMTATAISSNPVVFLPSNVLQATDVNASTDIITVTAQVIPTFFPFTIRGFRLEAIQNGDGAYPGPGIPGNNNFVLDFFGVDVQFTQIPVPEPSTLSLLGLGTLGLVIHRRRRARR
jgi:hypothetical protein